MAAAVAKHAGARHVVITDINPKRLELAKKNGVTRAVDVTKEKLSDIVKELGMTEGFDVGLEMSGSPKALNQMIDVMFHGGNIALLGILPSDAAADGVHEYRRVRLCRDAVCDSHPDRVECKYSGTQGAHGSV